MSKALSRLTAAVASVALAGVASAAAALTYPTPQAALSLAHTLAIAASTAERGVVAPTPVEPAVAAALQGAIISSGADPRLVLAAIDDALIACRPPVGRPDPSWTCPGTAGAFTALQSLRGIVVAQLGQTAIAATGTRGYAAFGSIPTTSPGGAGYLAP